ncbi:anti-sigma factor [Amnibacterium flavum]|uniref:Anti-sigma K factor RskA C-terminal domain-containing protein n=1 Tax=Amnibacterium flavum TaxID=2173173 RepID=A0A2V1HNM2_9MICO|nr:anti-sigma factor [Amnibacterium flavum]PVZ94001.1 hypothetical protein DDQ50_09600 [Amnibacterium flavum]
MSGAERQEHSDAELLALHALGEDVGSDLVDHLANCPDCQSTFAELLAAVQVGRSSMGDERLVQPGPQVWQSIRDELGLSAAAVDAVDAVDVGIDADAPDHAHHPGTPVRRSRAKRRLIAFGLAAAIAGLAVLGGSIVWTVTSNSARVLASAVLEPLPDWGDASGEAVLEEKPDGSLDVHVTLDATVPSDGYREVWLLTRDASALVSLGVLDGKEGRFTVPEGVDLSAYDIVDVSQEVLDGDPTHSGTSIVRGALT